MDWRDVLYPVYSRNQIEEYAFTLCVRSDGTYYGTADGNKCRQGSETTKTGDKEVTRKTALSSYEIAIGEKPGSMHLSKGTPAFDKLTDKEFANVINNSTDILNATPGEKTTVVTKGERALLMNKENSAFLDRLQKDPKAINERLRDVSDNELEASWNLLPKTVQSKLNAAAATKGTALQEDGTLGGPNSWRGKQLYKRYLQQDGKDLYTGAKLNFFDAEMEHIRGVKSVGIKGAEKVENWGWVRRTLNREKGERTLQEFRSRVEKRSAEATDARYKANRDKIRNAASTKTGRTDDAKMLAQAGYSIYKKYGNNKLHLIMTDLGIKNRHTAERAGGRTSSRYFLRNNLPKNFTDPDGKRVSAQSWIALNWGNWSKAERSKIMSVINSSILPKIERTNSKGSWDKAQKEVEDLLISLQ